MSKTEDLALISSGRSRSEEACRVADVCGLDELASRARRAPTHVVSILDPEQPGPPELNICSPQRLLQLRFHDAVEPLPGMRLPTAGDVRSILDFGAGLDADARLLVHCHFGISRSTAAMAMLIARDPSLTGDEVFARLLEVRQRAWPNSLMLRYADDILGRGGELMQALGRLYLSQSPRVPEIARFMRVHRRSETDMADAAAENTGVAQ